MPKSVYHVYQDYIWKGSNAELAKTLYDSPPIAMYDIYERASTIMEEYRNTLWHLPERMEQLKQALRRNNREIGCLTPEVQSNIETLEFGAIESAHQTVALGGPGYVLNKAVSASRVATMCAERGLNLAPYFCVADYDIVQSELTHMRTPLMGREGNLVSVPVPEDYQFSPVSQLPLPDRDWYNQVEESIIANYHPMFKVLDGPARKVVDERLEQALSITRWSFDNSKTLGDWATKIMGRLFNVEGRLGIPLVQASNPNIRDLLVEGLEFLLSRKVREKYLKVFDRTTSQIVDAGYDPGMGRRDDDYVPFFYECPNDGCNDSRTELHYSEKGATALLEGTCPTCKEKIEIETPADTPYLSEVGRNLSLRVDSRQLAIDTILPTVAHIGGPGETAYYAQVIPTAKALEVPFPLFMRYPRVYFNTPWGEDLGKALGQQEIEVLHSRDLFSTAGKVTRFRNKERYEKMNEQLIALHDVIMSTHSSLNKKLDELDKEIEQAEGKAPEDLHLLKLDVERYLSWCYGQYTKDKLGQESNWSWIEWAVSAGFPDLFGPYERAYVGPMKNGATLFINLMI